MIGSKLKLAFFIGVFSTLGFSMLARAEGIDMKNWTRIAELKLPEISVETDNKNMYVLPLGKDIVELSKKSDVSDIRLINKDKNEIPYVFLVSKATSTVSTEKDKADVSVLENNATSDGKRVLVIDTKREGLVYNTFYISKDPRSINFRKKVKAYISDTVLKANSPTWKPLEQKNTIYNYTDQSGFTVEKLDINLNGVSSRYVKLEFADDVDFDKNLKKGNIQIQGVQVEYDDYDSDPDQDGTTVRQYLSGNFTFDGISIINDVHVQSKDDMASTTELILDGGFNVEQVMLQVSGDQSFNRQATVFGSNDDITWIPLTAQNIYRINSSVYKGENLTFSIPVSTYKKFKVVIANDSDKPLDISKNAKLKIQNVGLMFTLGQGEQISDLRVVVGNNLDTGPKYDTTKITNGSENVIPLVVAYTDLLKNKEYKPIKNLIPFAERNKVFLNIVLIILICAVGITTFFWRRNKQKQLHD